MKDNTFKLRLNTWHKDVARFTIHNFYNKYVKKELCWTQTSYGIYRTLVKFRDSSIRSIANIMF